MNRVRNGWDLFWDWFGVGEECVGNRLRIAWGGCGVVLVHWKRMEVHLRGWWMCWLMWWDGGSFCTEGTGFV